MKVKELMRMLRGLEDFDVKDCGITTEILDALDAQPVIHGHWIKMSDVDGVYYACSNCGEDIPRISDFDPQFDLFPRLKSIDKTHYCPNCGADMREVDDERTICKESNCTGKRKTCSGSG